MRMFQTIVVLFFLILFFFLNPAIIYASQFCTTSNCGGNSNNISVRFPFRLQPQQPENCAYPGFDLLCSQEKVPILNLPVSGDFYARKINYLAQQIQIYDPDNCIPRRLLSLNLSGSPFMPAYHHNYTFLSCPTQLVESRFTPISCLSNSTISILATSSESLVNSLASSCGVIRSMVVPIMLSTNYDEEFSDELNGDIVLTWSEPNCGECEVGGGTCGFKTNYSDEVECFYQHKKGSSSLSAHYKILILVTLVLMGPAFSCATLFAIRAYCVHRRRGAAALVRAAVLPQPIVEIMGLNESTIATYKKMVLGESRRLPGTNDTTCPICLSEYNTKETIKFIPECQHCFHADCIDEWLRMNDTCPVCRNSPSPAHVNVESP